MRRTRLALFLLLLLGLGIPLALGQIRFEKPSASTGATTLTATSSTLFRLLDGSANEWFNVDSSTLLGHVRVGHHTFADVNDDTGILEAGILQSTPTWSPASNSGKTMTAVGGHVTTGGSSNVGRILGGAFQGTHAGAGVITNLIGTRSVVSLSSGSGAATNALGLYLVLQNNSAATITEAMGLQIDVNKFASGPITNAKGLYIRSTFGGVTGTKHGIYVEDTSFDNYLAGDLGLNMTNPAHKLDITLGTQTTQKALINGIGTWNAGGVTFTAFKFNITDTASAAASLLMDLQVGAASKWKVDKTGLVTQTGSLVISSGVLTVPDGSAGAPSIALASNAFEGFFHNNGSFQFGSGSAGQYRFGGDLLTMRSTVSFGWSSTADPTATRDVTLVRDAADTLAMRRTTNAQTLRAYGTYTDDSNYVRASLGASSTLVTLAAGTAGSGADDVSINLDPAGNGTVQIDGTDGVSGTCSAVTVVKGIVTGCTP